MKSKTHRRALRRHDAVRRDADNRELARVPRAEEGERALARQDAHLALLGLERPGQHVAGAARKRDADALRRLDGHEARAGVGAATAVGEQRVRVPDRLAAPAGLLAELCVWAWVVSFGRLWLPC